MSTYSITGSPSKPSAPNSPEKTRIDISKEPPTGYRYQVQVLSDKGGRTTERFSTRQLTTLNLHLLPGGKISDIFVSEVKGSTAKTRELAHIQFEPPVDHEAIRKYNFKFTYKNELTLKGNDEGGRNLTIKKQHLSL